MQRQVSAKTAQWKTLGWWKSEKRSLFSVSLGYIVSYYPSGTKQEKDSLLGYIMVERERALAERDVIAHLRIKTGQDLGDMPEAWIQKYGHTQSSVR